MWFKAKKGFDGCEHEWDGKYLKFYENKPTEAPKEFQKHIYTLEPCEPPKEEIKQEIKLEKKKEALNDN